MGAFRFSEAVKWLECVSAFACLAGNDGSRQRQGLYRKTVRQYNNFSNNKHPTFLFPNLIVEALFQGLPCKVYCNATLTFKFRHSKQNVLAMSCMFEA
jgi:hypothetical protein